MMGKFGLKWVAMLADTEAYANIHQDEADSQAEFWISSFCGVVEDMAKCTTEDGKIIGMELAYKRAKESLFNDDTS